MKINHEKITRDFCHGKTLLFFPHSADEVRKIRNAFRDMGFDMSGSSLTLSRCVETGMVFNDGDLSSDPSDTSLKNGYHCTIDQLHDQYRIENAQIMEKFNEMAKQLSTLSARVEEIQEQLRGDSKPVNIKRKLGG